MPNPMNPTLDSCFDPLFAGYKACADEAKLIEDEAAARQAEATAKRQQLAQAVKQGQEELRQKSAQLGSLIPPTTLFGRCPPVITAAPTKEEKKKEDGQKLWFLPRFFESQPVWAIIALLVLLFGAGYAGYVGHRFFSGPASSMSLTEFVDSNPAAKAEYEKKLAEAKADGTKNVCRYRNGIKGAFKRAFEEDLPSTPLCQ